MEETKNGAFYPADLKIKLNIETGDFLTKDEKANLTKEAIELFAIKTNYKGSLSELHSFVANKRNKNNPLTIEFEKVRQPLYKERRAEIKAQGNSPIQIRKTLASEIGHLIVCVCAKRFKENCFFGDCFFGDCFQERDLFFCLKKRAKSI